MNKNNYKKKKVKKSNQEEKVIQRYKINTTINFGSNIKKNLSLKLNAIGIEDDKYKITKLDFSN